MYKHFVTQAHSEVGYSPSLLYTLGNDDLVGEEPEGSGEQRLIQWGG